MQTRHTTLLTLTATGTKIREIERHLYYYLQYKLLVLLRRKLTAEGSSRVCRALRGQHYRYQVLVLYGTRYVHRKNFKNGHHHLLFISLTTTLECCNSLVVE